MERKMLSVEEINKLYDENLQLKQKISAIKTVSDSFADKFDSLYDFTDVLEVRSEDENGYIYGEEKAIWGDNLDDLENLLRDFIEFTGEIKWE